MSIAFLTSVCSNHLGSIQPSLAPGFAFSWVNIISHRAFMPKLLQHGNVEVCRMHLLTATKLIPIAGTRRLLPGPHGIVQVPQPIPAECFVDTCCKSALPSYASDLDRHTARLPRFPPRILHRPVRCHPGKLHSATKRRLVRICRRHADSSRLEGFRQPSGPPRVQSRSQHSHRLHKIFGRNPDPGSYRCLPTDRLPASIHLDQGAAQPDRNLCHYARWQSRCRIQPHVAVLVQSLRGRIGRPEVSSYHWRNPVQPVLPRS